MQPNFVANWQRRGGLYERRLGWDRARHMNPFATILRELRILAFGSDCMPLGPLYGIYGAMTHPLEEERLSFSEALQCYTHHSAYSAFMEKKLGIISTGYEASFIVLSLKEHEPPPKAVRASRVEMAVFRGEPNHFSKNASNIAKRIISLRRAQKKRQA